jgi:hypothetical protein
LGLTFSQSISPHQSMLVTALVWWPLSSNTICGAALAALTIAVALSPLAAQARGDHQLGPARHYVTPLKRTEDQKRSLHHKRPQHLNSMLALKPP